MLLILKRYMENGGSTMGNLYVGGNVRLVCQTLEPGPPLPGDPSGSQGHRRIKAGKYGVVMYKSPRFKRWVPLLLKVPGRSYIEIHSGNAASDTHGCILVGFAKGPLPLNDSQRALSKVVDLITDAQRESESVTLWVQDKDKIY